MMALRKRYDELYESILTRASLNAHPETLASEERKMQWLLLSEMSSNRYDLPVERFTWEEWYLWHEEHGTQDFVAMEAAERYGGVEE